MSNEELIERVKEANQETRRLKLAEIIVKIDEEVATSTANHEMRIGRLMEKRQNLLNAMDQNLTDDLLDRLTGGY